MNFFSSFFGVWNPFLLKPIKIKNLKIKSM
jgi:hypothetical protein